MRAREAGLARKASTPRSYMLLLTYVLLGPSPMAADDPNSQRDRKELEDKFAQLRPEVLETLRTLLSNKDSPLSFS
jgi:hypothetical protein